MTILKNPVHPGEILKTLYLEPLGMTPSALAKHLMVPRTRIERLCKQKVAMSADTAIRLAKFFDTTPEYWLNMQTNFDMAAAASEVDVSGIEPLEAA